jgi:hypothetical protein
MDEQGTLVHVGRLAPTARLVMDHVSLPARTKRVSALLIASFRTAPSFVTAAGMACRC